MTTRKATSTSTARRRAALKAWETRRAKARKRSEAAKKAWRTRKSKLD